MDLSDVKFYPEETVTINSLDGLRDNVNVFSGFTRESIPGNKITIEDNGHVNVDGESRQCTASAMRYLCKALRIPDPFANRIPFDLFQTNVQRLLTEVPDVSVFSGSNNHWVNFTSPKAWGVEIIPLVEYLEENLTAFDLITGQLSEAGVILDFGSGDIPEVKDNLEVGSITKFGRRFTGSESGFGYPVSSFVAFRLICSNGMVAPRAFGQVKCRNRGDQEAQIASFISRCRTGNARCERFALTYEAIAKDDSIHPNNRQLHRVWNGVRKILGDAELADEVIGIEQEVRSELRAAVKQERQLTMDEAFDETIETTEVSTVFKIPWFTLVNRVTASANKVNGRTKTRLQELGGKALAIAADTVILPN